MSRGEYVDRLKADYRKTFGTPSGRHVLMDLYSHLGGKHTSFPASGNPFEMAFNEGKRWAWLRIASHLIEEDEDFRKMLKSHLEERMREESG